MNANSRYIRLYIVLYLSFKFHMNADANLIMKAHVLPEYRWHSSSADK